MDKNRFGSTNDLLYKSKLLAISAKKMKYKIYQERVKGLSVSSIEHFKKEYIKSLALATGSWRSQMYLQMFQDKRKKWRFRLVANNGNILASSEAYSSKTKCRNIVLSIQKYVKDKTLQVVGND